MWGDIPPFGSQSRGWTELSPSPSYPRLHSQARIVKYKKHKRPNHFNFWITGLQKTLQHYNDIRQVSAYLDLDRRCDVEGKHPEISSFTVLMIHTGGSMWT